jgi:hypothetical protein
MFVAPLKILAGNQCFILFCVHMKLGSCSTNQLFRNGQNLKGQCQDIFIEYIFIRQKIFVKTDPVSLKVLVNGLMKRSSLSHCKVYVLFPHLRRG